MPRLHVKGIPKKLARPGGDDKMTSLGQRNGTHSVPTPLDCESDWGKKRKKIQGFDFCIAGL